MKLTNKQRQLFDKLHNSRKADWKTFSKRSYKGIWSSVIDKYPESAHFIYELLQNADDAEATNVYIILKRDQLLFKHNGTKHFDVTSESAKYVGDINSITGIGDSSKDDTQNKIGKFGVGFKAVFQYTDVPEIYDDTYKFKIENYIIPTLLEEDHPDRKRGETLFVFPFKEANKSYQDIIRRLDTLQDPILFLRHLKKITYRIDRQSNVEGEEVSYTKRNLEHIDYEDRVSMDRYSLTTPKSDDEMIFLFSMPVDIEEEGKTREHEINVGFYYDKVNKKLITQEKRNIYCFFPTKESFGTCFVSHAPFLLTDNRQNLKPGEELNTTLLKFLAKLATKGIEYLRDYGIEKKHLLIDENLTELIPERPYSNYYDDYDSPEYIVKEVFADFLNGAKVLLSRNKEYLTKSDAYICTPRSIEDLLSKKQFNYLIGNDNADFLKWDLAQKIRSIFSNGVSDFTSVNLAKTITAEFMQEQDKKWVTQLYTFLRADAPKLWKVTNNNKNEELPFRFTPIIKLQSGEWVAPYLEKEILNVYLPFTDADTTGYNFIHRDYLKMDLAMKFFKELDVREPDEYDRIKTVILGRYRDENDVEGDDTTILREFLVLVTYYDKLRNKPECREYIDLLRRTLWLKADNGMWYKPEDLYIETPENKAYFRTEPKTYVHDIFYRDIANAYGVKNFEDFLCLLDVKKYPIIKQKPISSTYYLSEKQKEQIKDLEVTKCHGTDVFLDGFIEAIDNKRYSIEVSRYIWNEILPSIDFNKYKTITLYYRQYHARTDRSTEIISTFYDFLMNKRWIFDVNGRLRTIKKIHLEDLDYGYNRNNGLLESFGIEKKEKSIIELGGTAEQQEKQDMAELLRQNGVKNKEELLELLPELMQLKAQKDRKKRELEEQKQRQKEPATEIQTQGMDVPDDSTDNTTETDKKDIKEKLKDKWDEMSKKKIGKPKGASRKKDPSAEEIFTSASGIEEGSKDPFFGNYNATNGGLDIKDSSKAAKNLSKKNTEAQEKAEQAEEQVEILELLNETPLYSYQWFKLLMELMHADKAKETRQTIQIDFKDNEIICSEKLIHLTNPSQVIPNWLSDADHVQIAVLTDTPIKINGLIVKSDEYSVDISVDVTDKIKRACGRAKLIRIVADNTTNFLDSLDSRFHQLGFEDDFNLRDNLPADISFIYGPPGTGKTTRLVEKVHDIVSKEDSVKVLVLTPTNKAADVVATKMVDDEECYNWLTRFGYTESLYLIEDAGVVMTREDTDLSVMEKNIIVTTAARYAYDYLQPDDTFLCDVDWDYIVIDEASMLDLLTITFILYKGINSKIIISGDPKQINPVVENGIPDYNIYDMVGLDDFYQAIHNFKRYPVEALTTQHRSVPSIGSFVSNFAYNGIVKSDTEREEQKPLAIDGIKVDDINFIGYDVKDFDDIYCNTAVKDSPFNLYAAIFTYNMVDYTVRQITEKYPQSDYSIGIVCPYGSESKAINQMLENRPIATAHCSVTCGTVHSFQGDECDIMFVVLNMPIVCSQGAHINKENIINVAMSRARDYLFFVMPNGQPKGFTMKNRIGSNADKVGCKNIIQSKMIEKVIFGNPLFIEKNTIVSCHKPVNVYCEESALYDVRISDEALDIRINQK